MKSALYHQTGKQPISFTVAQTHANGTVDLADAAGIVRISQCETSPDAAPGTCTLVEAESEPKAKAKDK